MVGKGGADTQVEAEHGLLQRELLQLTIVGEPVLDVLSHVEAELWSAQQEDAQHLADARSKACIASQHQALLLKFLVLHLQLVLFVEGARIDGDGCDGQSYLQRGTREESHAVRLIQRVAVECHLCQLEASLEAKAHLRIRSEK